MSHIYGQVSGLYARKFELDFYIYLTFIILNKNENKKFHLFTFTMIFRWLSIQSHKPSVGVHIFFNLNGHNIDSYASLFIAHAVVHNGRY
jgi:hypothetical protein